MAVMTAEAGLVQVRFKTKHPQYEVGEVPITVPLTLKRFGLSEVINHLLAREQPCPFQFLVNGELLQTSLSETLKSQNLSTEAVLDIEYFPSVVPPKPNLMFQHPDWVSSVSICAGMVATGCYDTQVRIWSESGVSQTISGHQAPVKAVQLYLNQNQATVISASLDQSILVSSCMDKGHFEPRFRCLEHKAGVECLDVNKDRTLLFSGSADKTICIWNISSEDDLVAPDDDAAKRTKYGEKILPLKPSIGSLSGHTDGVTCLRSFDAVSLFSGGLDQSVRMWDIQSMSNAKVMYCDQSILSLDVCMQNGLVASGHPDRAIRIWDARSTDGVIVKMKLGHHEGWISSLRWSPNEVHTLVSVSYDKTLRFWDLRSTQPVSSVTIHDDKILSVDWKESLIGTGGADGQLKLMPLTST